MWQDVPWLPAIRSELPLYPPQYGGYDQIGSTVDIFSLEGGMIQVQDLIHLPVCSVHLNRGFDIGLYVFVVSEMSLYGCGWVCWVFGCVECQL